MTLPTIEIIPNWHPIFVHFTIGLFSIAVFFYFASALLPKNHRWKQQWLIMANWSLWSGCLITFGTVIVGWLAYNSVTHDSASHEAMTLHRNWAIPTTVTFLLAGMWAVLLAKKNRRPGFLFLTYSGLAGLALMVTGWLGAEAVFRYGLGVKSLPKVEAGADGHNHSHGEGASNGHDHSHGEGISDSHDQKHGSDNEHSDGSTQSKSVAETDGHNHSHGPDSNHQNDSAVMKLTGQKTTSDKNETAGDSHQHNHDEGNAHQHESTETKSHDHGSKQDKELNQHGHAMAMEAENSLKPAVSSDSQDHSHNEGSSHDHQH